MAKRNNIGKQTLWTPVPAAKDSEVYTGDNIAHIDNNNISCQRKQEKKLTLCVNK
jgi:hypothetical protein